MVRTRDHATREEAVEAWNTWAGRKYLVSRRQFNRINDAVQRNYPIEDGELVLPAGEHAFGDLIIDEDDGYEHPWPRIYLHDYANADMGLYDDDDMFLVYKLRSRWRLLDRDHVRLKRRLDALIRENNRGNSVLNDQLAEWNVVLADSRFPLFEENDLRGCDLSGLAIQKEAHERVWLRGVDLSYSECHLLHLVNANLYGARCVGLKATQLDLSQATAHGIDFTAAHLPCSRFIGTDLGAADFKYALASHSMFDGANCHGCDFSFANLWRASFDIYVDPESGRRTHPVLSDITWNAATRFSEAAFSSALSEQNAALAAHIEENRQPTCARKELVSSVEMKPGAFGLSVDLLRVFRVLKRGWKKRRTTQPEDPPDTDHARGA